MSLVSLLSTVLTLIIFLVAPLHLPPVVVLFFIFDHVAHEMVVHFARVHVSLTHGTLHLIIIWHKWNHISDDLLSVFRDILLATAIVVCTIAIHILVYYKSIVNFTVPSLLLDESIAISIELMVLIPLAVVFIPLALVILTAGTLITNLRSQHVIYSSI